MKYKKDYGTCQAPAITDQDGVFVAMMFNEGELSNQLEETEAEKALSLLVAAPELLEACKYVVQYHRENDSGEGELFGLDFVTTCINAIRKAEGN